MDDLLSEKEQIDKMRAWWSDYGNYVIAGVVLGASLLYGINYMQDKSRAEAVAASTMYDALTDYVVDGPVESAETTAAELYTAYPDTAYAAQAKLAMARLYMDQNRDQDSADTLQSLLDSDASEAFKHVARVRLGQILLYQDKAQDVVTLVDGLGESAFDARYAVLRGDAYVALGEFENASAAYNQALADPQQASTIDAQLTQLKIADLPEIVTENAAETVTEVEESE